jgi:hypothetical protein
MSLEGATLANSREYQITGRHRIKILQIFKENPSYMTVALVLIGVRYRCDIWTHSCRLEVGDIVYARFIGIKEDYPNIYEVDIQPRYERTQH